MPQDGLISDGIEGNDRWRFLGEIWIGNVDERSESVISEIGAEDDRVDVRVNTEGIDRGIRAAVQAGLHLIDDLFGVDRWRPAAINHITRERIDDGKGSLDIEEASDVFTLDQADRS